MKYLINILPFLISLVTLTRSAEGQTQRAWHRANQANVEKLNKLMVKLTSDGYFERMMELGYVTAPKKADKTKPLWFRNENTYLFYRFSFDNRAVVDNYVIGTVFVSERQTERDYRKSYRDAAAYQNAIDGSFYYCKLFYDRKSNEFRVNIYPEYSVNLCRSGMHGNKKSCEKVGGDQAMSYHKTTIERLLSIPDLFYSDFILRDRLDPDMHTIFEDGTGKLHVNVSKRTRIANPETKKDTLFAFKKIQKMNYGKHIKCFSLGSASLAAESLGNQLELAFTKYPFSDDFLEDHSYHLRRISYDNVPKWNPQKREEPEYFTNNTWNISLVMSEFPDDFLFNDLNDKRNSWYFIQNDQYVSLNQGNREIELLRIRKARAEKAIDSLNVSISELNKKNEKERQNFQAIERGIATLENNISTIQKALPPDTVKIKSEINIRQNESQQVLQEIGKIARELLVSIGDTAQIIKNSSEIDGFLKQVKQTDSTLAVLNDSLIEARQKSYLLSQYRKSLAQERAKLNIARGRIDALKSTNTKAPEEKGRHEDEAAFLSAELNRLENENKISRQDSLWVYFDRFPINSPEITELQALLVQKSEAASTELMRKFCNELIGNDRFMSSKIAIRDAAPKMLDGNFYFRGNLLAVYEVRREKVPYIKNQQKLSESVYAIYDEAKNNIYPFASGYGVPYLRYDEFRCIEHEGYCYYWIKLKKSY